MNQIQYDWNVFKETWLSKINKSYLFYNFDNFITDTLKSFEKNREYSTKITMIKIFNYPIRSILFRNNILYIYESPFDIFINKFSYPVGLFLENIIESIIKFIENNSSSNIKILRYKNYYNYSTEDDNNDDDNENTD